MSEICNATKKKLLEETRHRCAYCGIKLVDGNTTFDHIKPRKKNGTGSKKNLCASCRGCNAIKWDRSLEEFRDIMSRSHEVKEYIFYSEKICCFKIGEEYGE